MEGKNESDCIHKILGADIAGQVEAVGLPNAVRAVAKVNGDNRIAIIIPCHRVIGANGELVGYGGGLWRKRYLLNHESSNGLR